MGEHGVWMQPSGLLPNGLLPNQVASVTRVLNMERWSKAEKRTAELIACIQPNLPSEEHRNAVASYVQQLIMKCFSCQVFTFGSVPLKTYLPDGDIDLTACGNNENLKDTWANAVREVLENEEKSENAEFRVKEVQYIQAEVKLIKCLVDNIVVDISFNQVGGLSTLCFLEEVDDLINQNHLFKRSIILIKAWCYYESRILGAHHGLISTYALETLVLYIFHVFNNSFAGPLEVLYRFLEFFSNFDWGNFCVSLWGPVPISSLPDMFAERPRKDNGKLFLSKDFLCSKRYGVIPRDQESQAQPFVSKHFNVVDPLRANNNLGRSVSKGNFFRIRSAFAFGAKRLARLLECPMEHIITEVNQFFMNTWERHGSGHRPDVPGLNLRHLQLLKNVPIQEVNNSKSTTNVKKRTENAVTHAGHGSENPSPEIYNTISQNPQNTDGINNCNTSLVSHSRDQKYYSRQTNSRVSDQFERSNSSSGSVHSDKGQKMFKPNIFLEEEGQGRFQFARTISSPELTKAAVDLSRGRRSRATETKKIEDTPAETDYNSRRKILGSEVAGSQNSKSYHVDPLPMRQSPSHKSREVVSDSNSASVNFHDDLDFGTVGEELASASEMLDVQQEAQDLINMMESANIHSLNGQAQLPMHLPAHFPLTLSPIPTSFGFSQRNWTGVFPPHLSMIGPSWGSNMQFPPGPVAAPLSHYSCDATLSSNQNDVAEVVTEGSVVTVLNSEDSDRSIRQENDARSGSSRKFNLDDNSHQMLHPDSKQHKPYYGLNPIRTSRSTNSGALLRGKNKFTREDRGLVREHENDSFQNQKSKSSDNNSNFRGANMRFSQASQASNSGIKPESEIFNGSVEKVPKSMRDKWKKKPGFSPTVTSIKSGSQFESSSDHVSPDIDEWTANWTPLSSEGTDMSERITGSPTLASGNMGSQLLHGFEAAQATGSDQLIQFAPVLVGTSQQSGGDNAKVVAFVPTGPPFPFVMVPMPVYGHTSQFERDHEVDNCRVSSDPNIDSVESFDHSEIFSSSAASRVDEPESSDEHKSDILNSDRNSHWQNLEYGRLCQNSHYHGPYPPLVVPPLYLQGQYTWDGPGRPISANLNLSQVMGYDPRLVPMISLQPGPDTASGGFQHYGDEVPRYRGGTGTYLPNPKVSPRERQTSSRSHRGNYSYDRHDHGDREGSWVSSKQRSSSRGHARNQAERPSPRPDRLAATENHVDRQWDSYGCNQAGRSSSRPNRLAATENHVDRQWDSYMHVPASSYMVQNSSFGSANSSHGSRNVVGTYTQSSLSSNAGGPMGPGNPPFVMVYSYDQGVGDGSSVEPLEFGSLGPVHLSEGLVAARMGEGIPASGTYEQSHGIYRVGSGRSSPDRPSSPQLKR